LQKIDGLFIVTSNIEVEAVIKEFYFPFRHQLLKPETRKLLQRLNPQQIADRELQSMHSPLRQYSPYKFQDDPFNLGGSWIQSLFERKSSFLSTEIPSVEDQAGIWYLVVSELDTNPFNLELQQKLLRSIKNFTSEQSNESFKLLTSGLIFHAAEGTHPRHFQAAPMK